MNALIRFCEPAPTIPVHTSDTLPAALDDLKADIREYARRSPTLRSAWAVGRAFLLVRAAGETDAVRALERIADHCGVDRAVLTGLFQPGRHDPCPIEKYARLATYLDRAWVRAAERPRIEVARIIVGPLAGGDTPPLPPLIRGLLFRHAWQGKWTLEQAKEVHAGLLRRLRALGQDTPMTAALVEHWIESASPHRAAALPPASEAEIAETVRRVAMAIAQHGGEFGQVLGQISALRPYGPELRAALKLALAHTGDLYGRIERELADDGGEEEERRGAGRGPVRRTSGAAPRALGDAPRALGDAPERPDRTQRHPERPPERSERPPERSERPRRASRPTQVPAPAPRRRSSFVHSLAVPYPGDDPAPSACERHGCGLITVLSRFSHIAQVAIAGVNKVRDQDPVSDALCMTVLREAMLLKSECRAVERDMHNGLALAASRLAEAQAGDPALTREDLFPVPTAGEDFVPLAYLSYEIVDPLGLESPSDTDRALWEVLGLIACARRELDAFHEHLMAGDLYDPHLLAQVQEAMGDAGFRVSGLNEFFGEGKRRAEQAEEEGRGELALAAERVRQAEANLLVLGWPSMPEQYFKFGLTRDGLRQLAISLNRGLSIITLGATGKGKSHLGVLWIEGLLLQILGLNRLKQSGIPWVFAADWRKGKTRHQHLCGLDPNPYAPQLQWLRQHFHAQIAAHLCVYPRVILYCMPGKQRFYQEQYPDLLERGLEVRELRLHAREWGAFGYELMLAHLAGDRKAAFVDLLRTIVAELGDRAHPHLVSERFEAAKAGGASRGAVKGRLGLMAQVTSERETLAGQMELDALHLVVMEDEFAGGSVLVPFQTAAMNAVMKGMPAGRMLLIVVEELGKLASFPEAAAFFEQNIREARHGLVSWLLGAHLVTDLTPAAVSLANGVVQFGGTSLADIRRTRELRPEYADCDPYELVEQPTGYASCAFSDVSDPAQRGRLIQAVLRPSCVHAGGETMQVG